MATSIREFISNARIIRPQPGARAASTRYWEVDALRGIAIGMMVLYHLMYDLDTFGDLAVEANEGFWRWFADATAFSFIFLAGVSLAISGARARETDSLYLRYLRRGLRIFGYGMALTVITWVVDPERFIKFGILHVIGLGIILGYPFVRGSAKPLRSAGWNIVIALGIIALGVVFLMNRTSFGFPWLYGLGIRPSEVSAFDYRPVFPWFGAMLLGIAIGKILYAQARRQFSLPDLSGLPPVRGLAFFGRWSLFIYFIHQPLLFVALGALGIIDLTELV